MNSITAYFKNAYQELMHNVSWPTWAELQSSAIVVLVSSIIIAIFVWIMDFVSKNGMMQLYNLLVG